MLHLTNLGVKPGSQIVDQFWPVFWLEPFIFSG